MKKAYRVTAIILLLSLLMTVLPTVVFASDAEPSEATVAYEEVTEVETETDTEASAEEMPAEQEPDLESEILEDEMITVEEESDFESEAFEDTSAEEAVSEDVEYPAGELICDTVGGLTIIVSFSEDVFPEGTTMSIDVVTDEQDYDQAIEDVNNLLVEDYAEGAEAEDVRILDFAFYDANGSEVTLPEGAAAELRIQILVDGISVEMPCFVAVSPWTSSSILDISNSGTVCININTIPVIAVGQISTAKQEDENSDDPVIDGQEMEPGTPEEAHGRDVETDENTELKTPSEEKLEESSMEGDIPETKSIPDGWDESYNHYYENGSYVTGWKKIAGLWYYFDLIDGWKFSDGVREINGKDYRFDKSGVMVTGWYSEEVEGVTPEGTVITSTQWYYSNEDGVVQYGWQTIDGKRYYLAPYSGWRYSNGRYLIDDNDYLFDSNGVLVTGWYLESGEFTDDEGNVFTWKNWYYADTNGVLQFGWQKINNKWYYLDPEGGWMYSNGIYEVNGKSYCFAASGEMKTGWAKLGWPAPNEFDGPDAVYSEWYYMDSDGVVQYGWQRINDKWYYFDPDSGYMYTGMTLIDENVYFFSDNGVMQTGWVKQEYEGGYTEWYYFGSNGMQTGWQKINGKRYYFNTAMVTGIALTGGDEEDPVFCYFDENGVFQENKSGWLKHEGGYRSDIGIFGTGGWFYLKNGYVQRGWQKINGKWYYFAPEMVTGGMNIDDKYYFFDDNGVWVSGASGWQKSGGAWYFIESNGNAATGWKKITSKWYYFSENGMMVTGAAYVDSKMQYFNDNGVWESNKTGWVKNTYQYYDGEVFKEWFYFDNGSARTGWQYLGGKWYYFEPIGSDYRYGWMYSGMRYIEAEERYHDFTDGGAWISRTNGWKKPDYYNGWFYFVDGVKQVGWKKIVGKWYYLDPNRDGFMRTGWLVLNDKWYYLKDSGVMAASETLTINGNKYTFNASGELTNS